MKLHSYIFLTIESLPWITNHLLSSLSKNCQESGKDGEKWIIELNRRIKASFMTRMMWKKTMANVIFLIPTLPEVGNQV